MTIRLFACGTKVCCGQCPGDLMVQLREYGCPGPVKTYYWWVPYTAIAGSKYASITWLDPCETGGSAIKTASADFEEHNFIPIGGCASAVEQGALIGPAMTQSMSSLEGCAPVNCIAYVVTIYNELGEAVASYDTTGPHGEEDPPFPECFIGTLSQSNGAGIGVEQYTAPTQDWPCTVAVDKYKICDSSDIIYRLTKGSAEAIEDIGEHILNVSFQDSEGNALAASLGNLSSATGCDEVGNTWIATGPINVSKVLITTSAYSGPPIYNVTNSCVGYRANVSDGTFCGLNIKASRYTSATDPCPSEGLIPESEWIFIKISDIASAFGISEAGMSNISGRVYFNDNTSYVGMGLQSGTGVFKAFFMDELLSSCEEVSRPVLALNITGSSPYLGAPICQIRIFYTYDGQPLSGTFYADICQCTPSNINSIDLTEKTFYKESTTCTLPTYSCSQAGTGTPNYDAHAELVASYAGPPSPYIKCSGVSCPTRTGADSKSIHIEIPIQPGINADALAKAMDFSEPVSLSANLPPPANSNITSGTEVRFTGTVSLSSCSGNIVLDGQLDIEISPIINEFYTVAPNESVTLDDHFEVAMLIPSKCKVIVKLSSTGNYTVTGGGFGCCVDYFYTVNTWYIANGYVYLYVGENCTP